MRTLTKITLSFALLFMVGKSLAQVGVSDLPTYAPNSKAMLDISSGNSAEKKGLLIPRMTQAQRTAITNTPLGLMVFETTSNTFWYFNGTVWVNMGAGGGAGGDWSLTGNTATNPATNFLGTTDNQPLKFRVNNQPKMELFNGPNNTSHLKLTDAGHNVFIGENVAPNSGVIDDIGSPFPTNAYNIAIGYEALRDNNTASNTVAIGWRALSKMGNNSNLSIGETFANTAIGDRALEHNLHGGFNTAIGAAALRHTTSSFNVAVGSASMAANTIGNINTAVGHESLEANTEGNNNTALGQAALNKNSLGNKNVALGVRALFYNRTGQENVAIGYKALEQASSDLDDNPLLAESRDGIVAVGAHALENNGKEATLAEHSSQNTAVGTNSLNANTTGYANTALGFGAMKTNQNGTWNTAIGAGALAHNLASFNVAIGSHSLVLNTLGGINTAVGHESLEFNTEGHQNTALGHATLNKNSVGSQNVAVGERALFYNRTGNENVAIGYKALEQASSDLEDNPLLAVSRDGIVAVGAHALENNGKGATNLIEGAENTALGTNALMANTRGFGNTALGYKSLESNTAHHKITAIGAFSMQNVLGLANNSITQNTAIGYNSLRGSITPENNTGAANTNVGYESMMNFTSGYFNSSLGAQTLRNNTIGYGNTAVGYKSLEKNIDGNNNVAIGTLSLSKNEQGYNNTANGKGSLENAINTEGNTAIGYNAMNQRTGGNLNTAIGTDALLINNGINNISIGVQSGYTNSTGSSNIFLGHNAGFNELGSNKLYIEPTNADKNNALIFGDFANDSLRVNGKFSARNNAVIQGFTKLGGYGSDVPSVKMKKLVGTTNAVEGGSVTVPHEVTAGGIKILSIRVMVSIGANSTVPDGFNKDNGYECNAWVSNTLVVVENKAGNSNNILNKAFTILVIYEE